jgi:hypothetical protein
MQSVSAHTKSADFFYPQTPNRKIDTITSYVNKEVVRETLEAHFASGRASLVKHQIDVISHCVDKYSIQRHRVSKWDYILYRIKECFLSIFGHSDWQLARKEVEYFIRSTPLSDMELRINHKAIGHHSHWKWIADSLLKAYVHSANQAIDSAFGQVQEKDAKDFLMSYNLTVSISHIFAHYLVCDLTKLNKDYYIAYKADLFEFPNKKD